MKKTLLLLLTLFLLVGCIPTTEVVTLNLLKPGLDEIKTASVGDIFFEREEGEQARQRGGMIDVNVGGFRYDLTIVELNEQKIGLMYAEYTYPNQMSVGSWMIKQGFNKRFDYALSDKVIRFRGFEFEIISVEKGLLRYRRVK